MSRFLVLAVLYVVLAVYGFQAFRTLFKSPLMQWSYIVLFLAALIFLTVKVMTYDPGDGFKGTAAIAGTIFAAFFLLALVLGFFLLLEDVVRLIGYVYNKIVGISESDAGYFPSRRKFISGIALGLAALPFGALLYGMYRGKYNYQVLKYELEFDDLPDAFHNYQITQISDVHSGSFDDYKKVEYGVNLINEQQSDVIFFTGDIVNNRSTELEPWKDVFSRLEAKDGVFSILGNHDYGDYAVWDTEEQKAQNLEDLKNMQKEMGFDLLLNSNRFLEKDGQKIALVGVENWGRGGFKKAGDLQKAKEGVSPEDFKILLSHDPSHWEDVVLHDDYHFHLTLSGHTHGMQFGVEIPGWIKWSPVKWRYKYWAGIYKELDQFINVNRGFGFIGYPGRFGIYPEISVITLKKKGLA
ncbi:MAG: metallophosphoesterase [Muricauda sp.]|jgi:predicted MPP superfamily phosphohydrolase|nr:metallophosphoesterase [Allomuricauda sp.]MBO6589916.1 metallophosphoesterase [Allomuricauda sp.]MBO6619542.1 metallophosphoesterase [Allomuricauda sp.]MBO6645489.1 metallophosphoesterase [Allomuricauda sp.]MBO6747696.1 metallophosphoesterase [Allomuricauda sp.]MBO6844744.1 metallophosphoesterase [Allomuricauda sp.]